MPFAALIPLISSLVGAGGQIAGSAIGSAEGAGDRAAQRQMLLQALREYQGLDVPTLDAVTAQELGPSAMEGVNTDPRLRDAQLSSLGTLGQFAQNGDTPESRAALNRILQTAARQEAAQRNAIAENMRQRGVSGSGAELAAQLSNEQAGAERAQAGALDTAAAAQKRMLDAALARGGLAGNIRGQDFSENSAKAQAKDMLARYNADSRYRAQLDNNNVKANQFNLGLAKANGIAGATQGVAGSYGQSADRQAATGAGVGQAIGQAATGVGNYYGQQAQRDEDWKKYQDLFGKG